VGRVPEGSLLTSLPGRIAPPAQRCRGCDISRLPRFPNLPGTEKPALGFALLRVVQRQPAHVLYFKIRRRGMMTDDAEARSRLENLMRKAIEETDRNRERALAIFKQRLLEQDDAASLMLILFGGYGTIEKLAVATEQ
jgi:hypothetical protein